jgi:hypothetical protein
MDPRTPIGGFMADQTGDEEVLEAARAVRPYLADLLGQPDAEQIDGAIGDLLRRSASANVDRQLLELFDSRADLRDWVAVFWEYGLPPDFAVYRERSLPPPGDPAPLPVPERFVCPVDGNYVRFVRAAFEDAGTCPDHHVSLVRSGSSPP